MDDNIYGFIALSMAQMRMKDAGAKTIYKRDSKLWRGWEKFVKAITFGKNPNTNKYLTTTIGKTIYLCDAYDDMSDLEKAETLAHEIVHVEQCKRLWYVGFYLLYVFLPFPVLFAYGRLYLELQAYAVGFKVRIFGIPTPEALVEAEVASKDFADFMFSGDYWWAWPFKKHAQKLAFKEFTKGL